MLQVSLFNRVMHVIKLRQPFTLAPFDIYPYKPSGKLVHLLKYDEEGEVDGGEVGWIMQWWSRLAIYNYKTISFNPTKNGLEIYYNNDNTIQEEVPSGNLETLGEI